MDKTYYRSIAGKVVVITGASSGVGRAMAIAFANVGARLVLAARSGEALDEVTEECQELGAQAISVETDVREMEEVIALVHTTLEQFEQLDIWINNAGVLAIGALEDIPNEVNEAVIRTNLIGYMNGTQAAVAVFKEQGYGTIINNISVGAWFPTPYMAAYCASKFGLQGFFDSLRGELRAHPHIHICDLYPGFLDTPGMQHAANYTGKRIMPAPPLYDPRRVARKALQVAARPAAKTSVGIFPVLLRLSYELFPGLSRNITGTLIGKYLKGASSMETTSGNVLEPVAYGTGIDGGWRQVMRPKVSQRTMLVAGAVVLGLLLLGRED